jgi:alpha-galactosidase
MKLVLIGAGSAQFGLGTMGDMFRSRLLRGAEICLMDINGESLERVRKIGQDFIDGKGLDFTLTATTDRAEALDRADHVIISIEVGDRFELWDQDWNYPLQYGFNQIYGENGGAGGLFHSLRIIPPILDICSDVMRLAPAATVFCYSNPMTSITTAVLRKFPELKFVGMCHEIASLHRYLPGILGTDFENLRLRAGGLNHFSVLISAEYADTGADAYPDILEKAPGFFEKALGYSDIWEYARRTGHAPETEGSTHQPILDHSEPSRPWSDRKLFREILKRYRLLPITVDSHIGEYIPWARDTADHQGIRDFYEFYRRALSTAERMVIDDSVTRERVVPIIEAMVSDEAMEEMAVNIMNNGLIPGLPDDVAVEVPATVSGRGIEGIGFDTYPRGFAALLRNYTGTYDLIAEAAIHGSRELAAQALLAIPSTDRIRDLDALIDHMVQAQRPWLDYLK